LSALTSEPAATETSPVVERRAPRRLVAIGVVVAIAATTALGAYLARDPFADLPDDPSVTVNLAGVLPAEGEEPLIKPAGVAMSGNRVYVADAGAGTVRIFDRYGRDKGRIVLPGTNGAIAGPIAIAIDDADRLAVVDSGLGRVVVVTAKPAEEADVLFALGDATEGTAPVRPVAVAYADGEYYVVGSTEAKVRIYDSSGEPVREVDVKVDPAIEYPGGLVVADGSIVLSDTKSGRISAFNAETGDVIGTWPDTYTVPRGLARAGVGYAVADVLGQAVYVCDADGVRTHSVSAEAVPDATLALPEGVTWDAAKSRLYVTDSAAGIVLVFNVRVE
jgi:DNA-binding beta-propeller fold protein YncE